MQVSAEESAPIFPANMRSVNGPRDAIRPAMTAKAAL